MTTLDRPVGGRLIDQFEYGLDAPICLTWELTYACNLACVHCLSSSGRRDPRELSTAEAEAVPSQSRSRADPDAPAAIAASVEAALPSFQTNRCSRRGEIPGRQRSSNTASASAGPSPNPGGHPLGTD